MGLQYGGVLQTLYESREKKGIAIAFNKEAAQEIEAYLTALEEMTNAYKDNAEILKRLNEIKAKANGFLISRMDEDEIISNIRKLTTLTGPSGEKLNIKSFHQARSQHIKDANVYKQKTLKRIEQTITNGVTLSQFESGNTELEAFINSLRNIDQSLSGVNLDREMKKLIQTDGFKTYQKVKDNYIREWLRPLQEELGKPVEQLSQEEMQEAIKRMKIVMNQRLNEGNLTVHPKSESFREFNQEDHDMMNGHAKEFWLNDPLIDEFIEFTQAVLNRFTFMLDKQFLVFQFKSEPYLYLIGFSYSALSKANTSNDGSLLITPHIKAIIQSKDQSYRELSMGGFQSMGLYIDVLKETVKPFLQSLAKKINFEFSKEFKQHFRM